MRRNRQYSESDRAKVYARLMLGYSTPEIARATCVTQAVVRHWEEELDVGSILLGRPADFGPSMNQAISHYLSKLTERASYLRDPEWLATRTAGEAARVYAESAERVLRLLEAMLRANERKQTE